MCKLVDSTAQARKKSTKINSLGPETAGWAKCLPSEGVVAAKFVPSFERLLPWVSKEGIWDVLGTLLGYPGKVCAKKVGAHLSA